MGREVPAVAITLQDRRAYREKVRTCLEVFDRMLRESRFDRGSCRVGLEIEFNLVDSLGYAAMTNADVLAAIDDPAWTSELGQFNVELDSDPATVSGSVFSLLEASVENTLAHAFKRAEEAGSRMLMVGILPSLRHSDIGAHTISSNPRYKLLNEQILAARGEDMRICIDGSRAAACLRRSHRSRGGVHERAVPPAGQPRRCSAATGTRRRPSPASQVALGANSPFLFGRELWRETRITLFEQATDTRPEELKAPGRAAASLVRRAMDRRRSIDLFEENIRYFPALLPICDDEDPVAVLDQGGTPHLAELTLHNGTDLPLEPARLRRRRRQAAPAGGEPRASRRPDASPTCWPTPPSTTGSCARSPRPSRRSGRRCRSPPRRRTSRRGAARRHRGAWSSGRAAGTCPATELMLRHLLPLAARGLERWGVDSADVTSAARRSSSGVACGARTARRGRSPPCAGSRTGAWPTAARHCGL